MCTRRQRCADLSTLVCLVVCSRSSPRLRQYLAPRSTQCTYCKNKLRSGVVLLAAVEGDKIALVSGVTSDLTDRLRAGDIMKEFAGRLGGKGGGRPDMAQGGGSDVGALAPALADLAPWITKQLEA